MAEVLKTRNSASILLPLTVMNLANAALWTTYGMALQDVFIYAPNGIGLVLSLAQLGLACIYPSKPRLVPGASQLHDA
ncbi:bidirectional sugar transporter SWEET [Haematococcus lacustris]|uniref:Sugar transporter SWEET1 n=1 Tax=Haematococcus lacustris TaxID=44745 RepID=A0A699Z580_HAELA|nr:bidirectional sugar transporter SWEET [Haematococcus lacustris]